MHCRQGVWLHWTPVRGATKARSRRGTRRRGRSDHRQWAITSAQPNPGLHNPFELDSSLFAPVARGVAQAGVRVNFEEKREARSLKKGKRA